MKFPDFEYPKCIVSGSVMMRCVLATGSLFANYGIDASGVGYFGQQAKTGSIVAKNSYFYECRLLSDSNHYEYNSL